MYSNPDIERQLTIERTADVRRDVVTHRRRRSRVRRRGLWGWLVLGARG